ncbi:hypothetical protein UK23_21105 [Lentzea aerocolonigenes]|uniref:Orc1-like AAA ATPase domain-containing protein n=1 Tax=Lentzea aerocolonigenes TaxID=68170 RepID=A0A0F0H0N4_LENAE|nr:ATP-binding protein [Lentzea aerocolonigenes]KJK47213.1 hypothetical protein UK23_21105 [Lentzea aerocolonigenes]
MSAELLDRTAELAALGRAVGALAAGEPALVEISGGSGTGRSALLARAVELARGAGALVLAANGLPLVPGQGPRIVGEVMAQVAWSSPKCAEAASTGCVVAIGPPSGVLVTAEPSPPLPGSDTTPGEALMAVLDLARARPVLLAVDDADGYDDLSRVWLARLGERAGGRPIGIVVVTGPARRLLAGAEVLTARPLSPAAVAELARRRRTVRGDVADVLHRCTGGLPSVLHAVLDGIGPEADAEEVAESAAEAFVGIVVRAVAALPAEAAGLLRAIALCGPGLDFELTCAVAGLPGLGSRWALDLLAGAGLVSGEPPALAGGLSAERVLMGLARKVRDELHVRAARLAYRGAADVAEVARILESAPPLGDPWVVPVLRTAARRVVERGDPEAAVRYLERALREPGDPTIAAQLVLEIALVESRCSPEVGDRRLSRMLLESQPPECARVRLAAADQLFARGDSALARRTFGAMPTTGVERDSITALYWLVDDAPLEVPELGLLDVAPLPTAPPEPERAGAAALLCVAQGTDSALARVLARTALAAPSTVLIPRMIAACALALTGDLDEAVAGLDDVLVEARELGLNAVESQSLAVRAKIMLGAARLIEARADLDAATAALPLRDWHPDARPLLVAVEAQLCMENGFEDRAEELSAAVLDHELGFGHARMLMMYVRAELAFRRGDARTALALAEECGRRMLARGWRNPASLPWRSVAARASLQLGNHDHAEILCAQEVQRAREWGVPGLLGMAHLSRAPVSGDRHDLTEAVRLLSDSPYRLAHAVALLALAEVSEPHEAAPLVREAAGIAVRGRALVLLNRARRLGWVPGT